MLKWLDRHEQFKNLQSIFISLSITSAENITSTTHLYSSTHISQWFCEFSQRQFNNYTSIFTLDLSCLASVPYAIETQLMSCKMSPDRATRGDNSVFLETSPIIFMQLHCPLSTPLSMSTTVRYQKLHMIAWVNFRCQREHIFHNLTTYFFYFPIHAYDLKFKKKKTLKKRHNKFL